MALFVGTFMYDPRVSSNTLAMKVGTHGRNKKNRIACMYIQYLKLHSHRIQYHRQTGFEIHLLFLVLSFEHSLYFHPQSHGSVPKQSNPNSQINYWHTIAHLHSIGARILSRRKSTFFSANWVPWGTSFSSSPWPVFIRSIWVCSIWPKATAKMA